MTGFGCYDKTMSDSSEEHLLKGGNTNIVTRVGDTVRRQRSANSATIHVFLQHLESKGVPAPRFLGIDDAGREILTFIEGETGIPNTLWDDDDALKKSATLLRLFHDASLDFSPPETASWAFTYPDAKRREVICHNDFAPYNMVFNDGLPVAILDFDLCGPGPRIRDLAYLAYWMTPLSFSSDDLLEHAERDVKSGCRRLRLLCESYGDQDAHEVLLMVSDVLHTMSDEAAATQMIGTEASARLRRDGHFDHWAREADAFDGMSSMLASIVER